MHNEMQTLPNTMAHAVRSWKLFAVRLIRSFVRYVRMYNMQIS